MIARPLALVAISLFLVPGARAQTFIGPVVHVEDGDTFTIRTDSGDHKIRLCGIDSAERGEKSYRGAKAALTGIIGDKIVRCVQVGRRSGTPCDGRSRRKSRDRLVAQCYVGSTDIAAEMIRSGNACDWPKFSGGHYRLNPSTCSRGK